MNHSEYLEHFRNFLDGKKGLGLNIGHFQGLWSRRTSFRAERHVPRVSIKQLDSVASGNFLTGTCSVVPESRWPNLEPSPSFTTKPKTFSSRMDLPLPFPLILTVCRPTTGIAGKSRISAGAFAKSRSRQKRTLPKEKTPLSRLPKHRKNKSDSASNWSRTDAQMAA